MLKRLQLIRDQHTYYIVRYLVIGGSTFMLDIGLLIGLRELFHTNVYLAATASYWLSLIYNFWLNRTWTFGTKGRNNIHIHVALYTALVVFNYLVSLGLIAGLGRAGIDYQAAKAVAVGLAMSWNYLLYRFIFNLRTERKNTSADTKVTTAKV